MKLLIVAVLALAACATVAPLTNQQQYEMDTCPNFMTDEMRASGTVRCRAMCSSEGRDMAVYKDNCKCYCQPANGSRGDLPPAKPQPKKNGSSGTWDNQT